MQLVPVQSETPSSARLGPSSSSFKSRLSPSSSNSILTTELVMVLAVIIMGLFSVIVFVFVDMSVLVITLRGSTRSRREEEL